MHAHTPTPKHIHTHSQVSRSNRVDLSAEVELPGYTPPPPPDEAGGGPPLAKSSMLLRWLANIDAPKCVRLRVCVRVFVCVCARVCVRVVGRPDTGPLALDSLLHPAACHVIYVIGTRGGAGRGLGIAEACVGAVSARMPAMQVRCTSTCSASLSTTLASRPSTSDRCFKLPYSQLSGRLRTSCPRA